MKNKPLWRDAFGAFTACAIVISFIAIGFVAYFGKALLGLTSSFDPAWLAAMLSLASTAFGYLIGKRTGTRGNGFDRPLCGTCPIRQQIKNADGEK